MDSERERAILVRGSACFRLQMNTKTRRSRLERERETKKFKSKIIMTKNAPDFGGIAFELLPLLWFLSFSTNQSKSGHNRVCEFWPLHSHGSERADERCASRCCFITVDDCQENQN